MYLQQSNGSFSIIENPIFSEHRNYEDVAATFIDIDQDGDQDLYVVSGGNEWPVGDTKYLDRIYINNGQGILSYKPEALPNISSSGAVALPHDYDNDGDLDLFIGSRHSPRLYPTSPEHYLLNNENGVFIDVTSHSGKALSDLGMVTDGLWVDLDEDGQSELVLVGEWMPISIFNVEKGQLNNVSDRYDLENTRGWWNSISTSDLNNDGRQDLIIGNLGKNYKYQATDKAPFKIYADDYDGNGTTDIFLTKEVDGKEVPIRGRECSAQQLPEINTKFKTYNSFANADIHDILSQKTSPQKNLQVDIFESIVLRY